MTQQLVRYDTMCRAIEAAYRIDEVKDIRNKALALEHYARQAKNKEALRQCGQIKLRAERKAGELLAKMQKAPGARGSGSNQHKVVRSNGATAPRLADLGITKTQASQWQQLAALPREQVDAALARATIPTTNGLLKKPRREQRERDLGEATRKASEKLGTKLYGVIYADPPWRWEPYSRETGMDRAADNHYPTMGIDEIKAIKVPAAKDAVLFLWATSPMLPEALEVMAAWGFTYKSHCVWLKNKFGTGYWFRSKHELLLVGTRGNIPAPAQGDQYASVIEAKVGKHSAKPNHFAEIIDELFPNLPGIELFARNSREGWDAWGAEAPC